MKPRTSLCLLCRTPLEAGEEECDFCSERNVVSLADSAGRSRAVAAAWQELKLPPNPFWKRALYMVAVALVLAATIIIAPHVNRAYGGAVFLGFIVAGGMAAVGVLIAPLLLFRRQEEQGYQVKEGDRVKLPVGTVIRPRVPAEPAPLVGVVTMPEGLGGEDDESPRRAEYLELTARSDKHVTLRDAYSLGFALELDDGRHFVVPAGRIRIVAEREQLKHAPRGLVTRRLERLDPARNRDSGDPYPFELARWLRFAVGDRVAVVARHEERWGDDRRYRNQARVTLVPTEMPWLRPA